MADPVQEPTVDPRWATSPPNGDDDLTEPTEQRKDEGWPTADLPTRETMNWWMWVVYLWIWFLSHVRFRWSDLGEDWDVPDSGTLPITSATLTGTTGEAIIYTEGRRVLGELLAMTFEPDTDTYLDLNRDAEWVPAVVANDDPEPAVAATARRQWMVRTEAGAIVSVTDMREAVVGIRQNLELGRQWLGTAVKAVRERLSLPYAQTGGISFTLLWKSAGDTTPGAAIWRVYRANTGGYVIETHNAAWTEATGWARDAAGDALKIRSGVAGIIFYKRLAGSATPWTDVADASGWEENPIDLSAAGIIEAAGDINAGGTIEAVGSINAFTDLGAVGDANIGGDVHVGGKVAKTSALEIEADGGDAEILLKGTNVKIAKSCEGQGGLAFFANVPFTVPMNDLADGASFVYFGLIAATPNVATGDYVIAYAPSNSDATQLAVEGLAVERFLVTGADQLSLRLHNYSGGVRPASGLAPTFNVVVLRKASA